LTAALLLAEPAMAQRAEEPLPPQAAPSEPGLIGSIGRFFEQGADNLRDQWRGAQERAGAINQQAATAGKSIGETAAEVGKGAVDVTRGAVDAVVKLPAARVIQGRQICEAAPNGAPDCRAAAEALCRGKGFAGGTSMDFTSAQKCPARVWAAGRQANVAECTTETFISRAMCQ
jgi:hypothetical protein